MKYFKAYGAAMQTTAALAKIATTNAIKTLMQIAPPASNGSIYVVEWGISFDAFAAAAPGTVELIETDVAASSLTAYVAADITKITEPDGNASNVQLGTALSGFGAGTEGSTTAVRTGDAQVIAPTSQYIRSWPLDQAFEVRSGKFLRVRVTFAATVNAIPWVTWAE
jgi:hypothetical protein